MPATPFTVSWGEAEVARLLDRVRAYEFPRALEGSGWQFGCDASFLRGLCAYWVDGYDWRGAAAARLGASDARASPNAHRVPPSTRPRNSGSAHSSSRWPMAV